MKADASVLSPDEIASAIRGLTDAQTLRLRKAAQLYAALYFLDPDDLKSEATVRALSGSRKCPRDVDVVRFLVEAMRSIANGESEKAENEIEVAPVSHTGEDDDSYFVPIDGTNPEEITIARQEHERLRAIFDDDPKARDLLDGIVLGYEGEELRNLTDLSETEFASKRRLIRRRLEKEQSGRKE